LGRMWNGVDMGATETPILRGFRGAYKRRHFANCDKPVGEDYSGWREERTKSRSTVTLGP
jgi:hypothetical protein